MKKTTDNKKTWLYTSWAVIALLGLALMVKKPNASDLNDVKSKIASINKQIETERNAALQNSPYKTNFDVIGAEGKVQKKLVNIVSKIYNKRNLKDQVTQEKQWKKELPGKAGANFIKNYGDSFGYISNKFTQVYFGNPNDISNIKVYVITVAETESHNQVNYSWIFNYNLKDDKVNSFREVSVGRN